MNKLQAAQRWGDDAFLNEVRGALYAVFVDKRCEEAVDLRGIVVGLDGAIDPLINANLQDTVLAGPDLSYARLSCSLNGANVRETQFRKAMFDTCRFMGARFERCSFEGARLNSPTLDDAAFLDCTFDKGQIRGRGWNEYGGRRILFEGCTFRGTVFQNLQLRACKFRRCAFHNTTFKKCILAGVSFVESSPNAATFVECETIQCTIDGNPVTL